MDGDTIAAIATPVGAGGIGIIRMSGPASTSIAHKIFVSNASSKCRTRETTLKARKLSYGHIIDPETRQIVDEALLAYMPSPKSYTREDVIEIQAHAGILTLKIILELVLSLGARLATPGEFTKRAFLNGRIDLAQAEAVMDLIQAKSVQSLKMATKHIEGAITNSVEEIIGCLETIQTAIEADIEFGEEVDDVLDSEQIYNKIKKEVMEPLDEMIQTYEDGHFLRDGLRLVILGKPNVGKSSLMNHLLEKERAIVTERPGTTRDSLEETILISGLPVQIIDTAGMHDTEDLVENLGIQRTQALLNDADLVLFLVGVDTGIDENDRHVYKQLENKPIFLVVNKIDLIEDKEAVSIPERWSYLEQIEISAKYGTGIEALKKGIYQYAVKEERMVETAIMPNLRQKELLSAAKDAANATMSAFNDGLTTEAIAIDIEESIRLLKEIKGESVQHDVLDNIFSQFCIGK